MLGEICAAYAAGQLSAEQAILVAYYRGHACSQVAKKGIMLAVGTGPDQAIKAIESLGISDQV